MTQLDKLREACAGQVTEIGLIELFDMLNDELVIYADDAVLFNGPKMIDNPEIHAKVAEILLDGLDGIELIQEWREDSNFLIKL